SRPSASNTCRAYISFLSPSGGFAATRMRSPTRIVPSSIPIRFNTVSELVSMSQPTPSTRIPKYACGLRHSTSVTSPSTSTSRCVSKRPKKLWCAAATLGNAARTSTLRSTARIDLNSIRLTEDEERLVRRAARARREHHLRAVVGRVSEQVALLLQLEAGREHLLLDRVDPHAMDRPGVAPARAILGLVIDDEKDSPGLQRIEDLAVERGGIDALRLQVVVVEDHPHRVDVLRQRHVVVAILMVDGVCMLLVELARRRTRKSLRIRQVVHVDVPARADGRREHRREVLAERRDLDDLV